MSENPFQSPADVPGAPQDQPKSVASGRAAYNVVTDTVTGVNLRWSDNKFQAVFVLISVAVGALVGAILAALIAEWNLPWGGGAMIGAFGGLVIGVFASGIVLMFYRAVRHFKGEHD